MYHQFFFYWTLFRSFARHLEWKEVINSANTESVNKWCGFVNVFFFPCENRKIEALFSHEIVFILYFELHFNVENKFKVSKLDFNVGNKFKISELDFHVDYKFKVSKLDFNVINKFKVSELDFNVEYKFKVS